MRQPLKALSLVFLVLALLASSAAAQQAEFDWKRYEGETLNFLSSNHPWSNAVMKRIGEFLSLTGIGVRTETFQEQQMRQRLVTLLQSRSRELDLFMSLKSREGLTFYEAGWYRDLYAFVNDPSMTSPDYDFEGLSRALVAAEVYDGVLTGIPLNIEGPVFYYRTDILERCSVQPPTTLEEIETAAQAIRACDPDIVPFASRGLAPAVAYTLSNFLHNAGATYLDEDGRSNLCSDAAVGAIDLYSRLLRDYGPEGVVNYSFYQLTTLTGEGRVAMSFMSSNEFGNIMAYEGRSDDLAIMPLPPGAGGSVPTVIGWGISMSDFAQNPGPAWYFIQWATSPEMQLQLAFEGLAPPRAAVAASAEYRAWVEELPIRQNWVNVLEELGSTGTSEVGPPIKNQPESRQIIGEAIQQVILNQASARDAACAADVRINRLIDDE